MFIKYNLLYKINTLLYVENIIVYEIEKSVEMCYLVVIVTNFYFEFKNTYVLHNVVYKN